MKERVVVIDDNVEFLELTWTWLDNSGYEVVTAENGIEGLRRVYISRPDLVLLDANMPEMDGWEVCRRIRDMADIPIIMITVNGHTRDLLRGFDLGVDDYITKPVDFEELVIISTQEEQLKNYLDSYDYGDLNVNRLVFEGEPNYSSQINYGVQNAKGDGGDPGRNGG